MRKEGERETADTQDELDRALIDHSFRKKKIEKERRGRVNGEMGGGPSWVIHPIYEGQRPERWAVGRA